MKQLIFWVIFVGPDSHLQQKHTHKVCYVKSIQDILLVGCSPHGYVTAIHHNWPQVVLVTQRV